MERLSAFDVERRGGGRTKAIAHGRRADVERRQNREQMTADIAPRHDARRVLFRTSFMAAKIGRSGQPVQKPAGRWGTTAVERFDSSDRRESGRRPESAAGFQERADDTSRRNLSGPSPVTRCGVFATEGQHVLTGNLVSECRDGAGRVLRVCSMIFRLALLDHQHRLFTDAELERSRRRSTDRRRS